VNVNACGHLRMRQRSSEIEMIFSRLCCMRYGDGQDSTKSILPSTRRHIGLALGARGGGAQEHPAYGAIYRTVANSLQRFLERLSVIDIASAPMSAFAGSIPPSDFVTLIQTRFLRPLSNIRRPSDVNGVYGAAGAGVAVGPGAGGIVLTNQNGAVLTLAGRQAGLIVAADLNGLVISLR
jgi:hypothetical protein